MMFTVRKIDSVRCLSFGYTPSYPICLLCIHLWLPQSVETESFELYFQRTRMQAVLEGWFVLLLFFSEHLLLLSEFVQFYFVLPFPLQSALPSWTPASFKQDISEEGREKPGCFDTSPILALPLPYPCFIWHRSLDCGKDGCQLLREVLGMP